MFFAKKAQLLGKPTDSAQADDFIKEAFRMSSRMATEGKLDMGDAAALALMIDAEASRH